MNYDRHLEVILAVFTVAVVVASLFVIVKGLWIGDHVIVIYGLWGILGGIPLGMFVLEGLVSDRSYTVGAATSRRERVRARVG